jgi:hypothetical protein
MDYAIIGIIAGLAIAIVGYLVYKHNGKTVAAVEAAVSAKEAAVKTVVEDVKKV